MARSKTPIQAGQRFGLLTTMHKEGKTNDGHFLWKCVCDCGGVTTKATNNLRVKNQHSCGCWSKLSQICSHSTHGMKYSIEYSSWGSAKDRCHNPLSKDFYRYGGRGISMCTDWRESFEKFYADMGARPKGTSLDRYPNQDGNYEPGNCRWATAIEQARNKKKSIWVQWRGVKTALADIAKELGITYGATFQRHKRGKLYEP